MDGRPILCVDVDGVINHLGTGGSEVPAGVTFEILDGVPHAIYQGVGERLKRLESSCEMVWTTGWGGRANLVFPELFGIEPMREVRFKDLGSRTDAGWKIDSIEEFAAGRPLAWVDDSFSSKCRSWAERRSGSGHPTLLVGVDRRFGLRDEHVLEIEAWAGRLPGRARAGSGA